MRAISDALYFTTVYSEQIQSLCVKRLKDPTFKKVQFSTHLIELHKAKTIQGE